MGSTSFLMTKAEMHNSGDITVLILDDNNRWIDQVAKTLSRFDCKHIKANSYDQALVLVNQERIELAFVDLNLDAFSNDFRGIEFVSRLAKSFPNTEVVVLSAYLSAANLRKLHGLFHGQGRSPDIVDKMNFNFETVSRNLDRVKQKRDTPR